jgi:hypothetical protein
MDPELVGPDPLFVYEGNALLDIFDLRQPGGPSDERNLYSVFQKQTGIGPFGMIAYYFESHLGRSDLIQVMGDGHKVPKDGTFNGQSLGLQKPIHK